MALSRGPYLRQCCRAGTMLRLQHGASAIGPAEALESRATWTPAALRPDCARTFTGSPSYHKTRQTAQKDSRIARTSALTDARSQDSVAGRWDLWTEVVDKETGQVYYWNKQTNETTALGEPKPGPEGRRPVQQAVVGKGTSLLGLVGVGAGIGLTFGIIGRLLGG